MRNRPQVLLVEDSEDDAYFFRRVMVQAGVDCDLVHVNDGEAALELLTTSIFDANRRPDVIFLDLKLPVYDGFEILRWIQSRQFEPPIKTMVLSGSEREIDVSTAKSLGAKYYFVKPISADQFQMALREIHGASPDLFRQNA